MYAQAHVPAEPGIMHVGSLGHPSNPSLPQKRAIRKECVHRNLFEGKAA